MPTRTGLVHQPRATAAAGARLGMHVRMFLRGADPNPPRDGNLFLDELLGAELSFHTPAQYGTQRQQLIDDAMNAQRAAGRKPYFFPVGGSVPLGCWGYIRCMHELSKQLDASEPHDIVVAVGSSGTLAGCVLGKALLGLEQSALTKTRRKVIDPKQIGMDLLARGPKSVVLKLGKKGAMLVGRDGDIQHVRGFDVDVTDTTAAGDAFTAALAVAHQEQMDWPAALRFANAAGALPSRMPRHRLMAPRPFTIWT